MPNAYMRFLALCAIIGGVLQILSQIGFNVWGYGTENNLIFVVFLIGYAGDLLILLSLVSLFHYSYKKKPSRNVAISHLFFFIGITFNLCLNWYATFNQMIILDAIQYSFGMEEGQDVSIISAPMQDSSGVHLIFSLSPYTAFNISLFISSFSILYYGISSLVHRAQPRVSAIFLIICSLSFFSPLSVYYIQFIWGLAFILFGRAVYRDNALNTGLVE